MLALTPIYTGRNLLKSKSLAERIVMARVAQGSEGTCIEYVQGIATELRKLGIDDPAVREFWHALQQSSDS